MTKRQRRILTVIILFASIGLVIAQTIWIFGVFTNIQYDIGSKVNDLLNNVVTKVWQTETLTQISDGYNSQQNIVDSIVYSSEVVDDDDISERIHKYFRESYERLMTSEIPVEQRVTMEQIDSLVYQELKEVNLNQRYKFKVSITDRAGRKVMRSSGYNSDTKMMIYKKRLFPHDPEGFSEIYYLNFYFPEETLIVLIRIWPMIFAAFILIVVILALFIYTMYVIARQKRISEIKGDFISNITHELKTPISSISLAAQMLGDENIPQSAKNIPKLSSMIKEQSQQLSYLVEKVLQTSVFEKQSIVLKKANVSLHAIIKEADDLMTLQLRNKKATLITELRATDDIISTDKAYFVNVITNLMDNALKYSRDVPKITIGTRNEYGKILCYVSDNGIGLSPENKDRIFEQFFRVNTGDVHDVKGFGLGLNYVKKIVDLTDGTISVESEENVGTTFYIWLPLIKKY
ncbi:MAG: HAMP domain-containing histidine kinase [Prevotellaceae bacterium]|jgi:two-component system phosphate regulon sensor histidine kinase PhoR|nr:HAMP domain-containing histidine kinase [Prevotellaceae bacterium]